jgi:hypothetical protein
MCAHHLRGEGGVAERPHGERSIHPNEGLGRLFAHIYIYIYIHIYI